jgi:membrane-bound lytic murein transglycosylase F
MGGHLRPAWLLLSVLVPSVVLAGLSKHVRHPHWTDNYDRYFKKYAKHYFGPGFDWRWFKAQGIAESGLDPAARSAAGAKGIMQIMPGTFAEIRKDNPHFQNIEDPHWNIAAAIYYDRKLYRRWLKRLPKEERLDFTFASYNAGYSRVRRAFERVAEADRVKQWEQIAPLVPPETRRYVDRIQGLMQVE